MIFKIECLWCKKEKETEEGRAKFCSISCGSKYTNKTLRDSGFWEKRKTGRKEKCKATDCDKQIYRIKSEIEANEHIYCSRKCLFKDGNWNSGLTKETDERVMKLSKTLAVVMSKLYDGKRKPQFIKSNCKVCKIEIIVYRIGGKKFCDKCRVIEARNRILITLSKRIANGTNTSARCKWYTHIKPSGEVIKVQGTFELKFAKILDRNKISYKVRNPIFRFEYLGKSTIYSPDFYLIDYNTHIEVKGDWDKASKEKFKHFLKIRPDVKILVIYQNDLFRISEEELIQKCIYAGVAQLVEQ